MRDLPAGLGGDPGVHRGPQPRDVHLGPLRRVGSTQPGECVLVIHLVSFVRGGVAEPRFRPHHEVSLDDAVARVAELAAGEPRVVAIGETGLDNFRTAGRGHAVQREAFRAHIALAKELDLPLQIHDRDAHADVLDVLRRDGAPERTVFHCFSGDPALAEVLNEHGWYASFAGPITYKTNEELRAACRAMDPELVLVETDAPYLTPAPFRGRPNASYLMTHTVRAVAVALGMELTQACQQIMANTRRVYGAWWQ